jgi:hypothetical protein
MHILNDFSIVGKIPASNRAIREAIGAHSMFRTAPLHTFNSTKKYSMVE